MNIPSILAAGILVCNTLTTTTCSRAGIEAEAAKHAEIILWETIEATDETKGPVLQPEQKLVVACAYNSPKAIQKLLQQGVTPDAMVETIVPKQTPEDLETKPVIYLAMNSWNISAETLEFMLKAGATPTDELLFEALYSRQEKWVEVLLKYGANANACHSMLEYREPEYAIMEAAYAADRSGKNTAETMTIHLINHGADVRVHNTEGNTALHAAVTNAESLKLIELLLQKGADINAQNNVGETPLMAAAREKNHSIYRFLLKHGANPDLRNHQGKTAAEILHYTPPKNYEKLLDLVYPFFYNEAEAMQLLQAGGLDINHDYGAGIILKRAMGYGSENAAMVRLLLKHGAKTEFEGGVESALYQAVYHAKNMEIAQILLEHGASADGVDLSQLLFAVRSEEDLNTVMQHWLPLHQMKSEHVLFLAEWHPELLKKLLKQGLRLTPQDAVMKVVVNYGEEDTELLQMLYDAGANPNTADKTGKTALMNLDARHTDSLRLLLSLGADINRQDIAGNTALHYLAIKMAEYDSTEDIATMFQLMQQYGANPQIKNNRGETPLDTAIRLYRVHHLFDLLFEKNRMKYDVPHMDKNGKADILNPEGYLFLLQNLQGAHKEAKTSATAPTTP